MKEYQLGVSTIHHSKEEKRMKKIAVLFLVLFIVPSLTFAVSNAKLNGQKELKITQLPATLVFTCDLASAGNKLAFEYYLDFNGDGKIGPYEEVVEFYYITDGIGWIKDPSDPDNDFAGDETDVDGKIKTTAIIYPEDVFLPKDISGTLKVIDEDGSTDFVKFTFDVQEQPPFLKGKVTDSVTGAPIAGIYILAERDENSYFAVTDENGEYRIDIIPATYMVSATEMPPNNYQMSEKVEVTVTELQDETVNFTLEPFTCHVEGKLQKEDGTPVPGIVVTANGGLSSHYFSMATSDDQGYYRLGVMPGVVKVGPSFLFNFENENWPQDYYADPSTDSLNINEGQTLTSDFVFKPYTAFITGTCSVNGAPLADVTVTGLAMDMSTLSLQFYQTMSEQDGTYRLGVLPGTITNLNAYKEGYDLVSPQLGYMQITIRRGQTISGKDFGFVPENQITSISGNVSFMDGSPAANVYVAAENFMDESPDGFLIAYTDNNGDFLFNDVKEGDYHLGVYKKNYSSDPPMRTFLLNTGTALQRQNFVLTSSTGVTNRERGIKPRTIHLAQNFPNPFNPSTTISFELPQAAQVEVDILNTMGQRVRSLVNGYFGAGEHQVTWDGRDDAGQKVSSGVYFYMLKAGSVVKTMKMIFAQ